MPRPSWVLLSSRLPREPSRLRLAVWRRLKRTGAVLLHDAVWVLPADPATREAVEWLAEEIEEQGGTAFVWEAAGLSSEQDRHLMDLFRRDADARYAEIEATARAIQRATVEAAPQRLRRARPSDRCGADAGPETGSGPGAGAPARATQRLFQGPWTSRRRGSGE